MGHTMLSPRWRCTRRFVDDDVGQSLFRSPYTHSTFRPLPCACTTLLRSICAHGLHLSTPHIRAVEQRERASEKDRVRVGNAHIYLPSMPANKRHRPYRWRISDTFCEGRKIEVAVLVYSQNTHTVSLNPFICERNTRTNTHTHHREPANICTHHLYREHIYTSY